jgi:hypothetical protein
LAQTVADLHRLGISHGELQPQHVFVTPSGQPVLHGFGNAGLLQGRPGQPAPFDPAGDVEALADLLESALDAAETETRQGGSLVLLLHSATSCSMEQFAADLARMAAPARPPLLLEGDPLDWTADATRDFWPSPPLSKPIELSHRTRRRAAVGAVLALIAVIAGALTVAGLGGPGKPTRAQAAPAAPTTAAAKPSAPPLRNALPPGASPDAPASPPTPAAPATGPSGGAPKCPNSHDEAAAVGISASCATVTSSNGNQIRVGDLSWTIGAVDDLAVAGDFDCDGWLDVAGLARTTGDIVIFDRWAGAGGEPVGQVIRRIPSANRLEATASGTCHRLAVHRADGAAVAIDLGKHG